MPSSRSVSLLLLAAAGCAAPLRHIATDAPLGRVVIYRNGVAFYERRATLDDGHLRVQVPRERVDDFLKSLTIVDVATGERLAVTIPRQQEAGDVLVMDLRTAARSRAEVVLTYVTEAAAWKPSYRIAVADDGQVELEGWAVVDNTSGEDWRGVQVGVGASSALSFRYDLWSVREVDRAVVADTAPLAIAPPTAVTPWAEGDAQKNGEIVAWFDSAGRGFDASVPVEGDSFEAVLGSAAGSQGAAGGVSFSGSSSLENQYFVEGMGSLIDVTSAAGGITIDAEYLENLPPVGFPPMPGVYPRFESDEPRPVDDRREEAPPEPAPARDHRQFESLVGRLRGTGDSLVVQVASAGAAAEVARDARSRAQRVRNQLIDAGLAPARVQVSETSATPGAPMVKLVRVAARLGETAAAVATTDGPTPTADAAPVGESHFLVERAMDVPAATSAMVPLLATRTDGGVVYLYDPISARGDARYAFRAIRLINPTDDTLEAGPVTVYGEGRFIGEGLAEAIGPRATTVVPFAQDRQVVIDRDVAFADELVRLTALERGALTAELARRRTTTLTLHNRLAEATTVYVRHAIEDGWTLIDTPEGATRLASSRLIPVAVPAGGRATLALAETTPIQETLRLDAERAAPLLTDYLARADTPPALAAALRDVLAARDRIRAQVHALLTLREQLDAYAERERELTAQLAALAKVGAAGPLARTLRGKLGQLADRMQRATIDLVEGHGRLLVERTQLATQLAELRLP